MRTSTWLQSVKKTKLAVADIIVNTVCINVVKMYQILKWKIVELTNNNNMVRRLFEMMEAFAK